MKYQERLAELGVDKTMVSKGLQKKIKEFEELLEFVENSKNELEDIEDDESRQEVEDEINSIEQNIPNMDIELVNAINYWDRNKEVHASNVQKMADARAAKKLASSGGVAVAQSGTQTITQAGTNTVRETVTPPVVETVEGSQASQPNQEKKKSDWVWWGIAGLVAVVTLGSVIMSKEE